MKTVILSLIAAGVVEFAQAKNEVVWKGNFSKAGDLEQVGEVVRNELGEAPIVLVRCTKKEVITALPGTQTSGGAILVNPAGPGLMAAVALSRDSMEVRRGVPSDCF